MTGVSRHELGERWPAQGFADENRIRRESCSKVGDSYLVIRNSLLLVLLLFCDAIKVLHELEQVMLTDISLVTVVKQIEEELEVSRHEEARLDLDSSEEVLLQHDQVVFETHGEHARRILVEGVYYLVCKGLTISLDQCLLE